MNLSDFDYHLPQNQIAQTPARPRDHSRLLVMNRTTNTLTHKHFYDLPSLLSENDVLVINNSKTLPMRTFGKKESGGKIEVLFLKRLEQHETNEVWEVLTKPGLKLGQLVTFENTAMKLTCNEELGYTKKVTLSAYEGSVVEVLHHIGHLPTPHYIRTQLENENDYQTIYAKPEGSAATPTAGLHFTQAIFDALNKKNIQTFEVTLHVGLGTFLPVKTDDITKHTMHKEWFTITKEVAEKLNSLKLAGKRIIAVGTTSTRTLESCAEWNEEHQTYLLKPQTGETQAFFYPPYKFKFVDALITNFHLPKSTLLMLISAFCTQNSTFITFQDSLAGKAYLEAVKQNYRFFSFGDAMLIE
jgi:S-adenosylmethionine:tRNA ribosyltransferase-isomerase